MSEYIDWFNHRRRHGGIGLVPPAEFEADLYQHESASAEAEVLVPSL